MFAAQPSKQQTISPQEIHGKGAATKLCHIGSDGQCLCGLQVSQMPQLCQLNLLEAMPPRHPSSDHAALTPDDICNDMAACHVCQHSNSRKSLKSNGARADGAGSGTADDIAAFGRLLVQVYRGKMMHCAADDLK